LTGFLLAPLSNWLDARAGEMLFAEGAPQVDFLSPAGEPALAPADGVSWRVFKNPATLFIGGVAAVILELAEPRIRTGVWEHTTFRTDPVTRLRRTGLAAMVTVYGARSVAERMIAGIVRMHERISGATPSGEAYHANSPELLNWVQATAAWGFLEAYSRYASPLSARERDRYFAEGEAAARLYGAAGAPTSEADWRALYQNMRPRFERSDIVFEFLDVMRLAPALPQPVRLSQGMLIRAAIALVPDDAQRVLGLEGMGLRPLEEFLVRRMARQADRIFLPSAPAAKASERMGLPADWLYRLRR
jgi:uncharacterized protein (DUF2236 family)